MIMKLLLLPLLLLFASTTFGQMFEGKIVYENTYRSKMPNVTHQQLTAVMVARQEYIIKGGSYRSSFGEPYMEWSLYRNAENRLYTKERGSDVLLWFDGAENTNGVTKVEIRKGVIDILGYTCDEAILTTANGVEKYYFNTKLGVDPSLYRRHKYGNWYNIVKATRSVPLKMIIDDKEFTITSVATEVTRMKLSAKDFALPKGMRSERAPN